MIGHNIRGKEAEGEGDMMIEAEIRVLQFEDRGGATSQGIKAATRSSEPRKGSSLPNCSLSCSPVKHFRHLISRIVRE